MARGSIPGFYGKVPSLGDFTFRRLPRSFIAPWDRWLQQSIARSQEQLGTHWLDAYLISPIWRFALSPGTCGSEAWIGVLMPSVDKVGRYFPLTLGAALPDDTNLFGLIEGQFGAKTWLTRAESLVLSVLRDQDLGIEVFDDGVRKLGPVDPPERTRGDNLLERRAFMGHTSAWRIPLPSADAISQLYPKIMQKLIRQRFTTYSIWWCSSSEYVDSSMLVCEGLPPPHGYAAMISGQWLEWAWEDWKELTAE